MKATNFRKKSLLFSFFPILSSSLFLSSCNSSYTSNYFAEIIVSDNSSVLKDQSFSQSTYEGWKEFVNGEMANNLYGNDLTYNLNEFKKPEYHFTKMPDTKENSNLFLQNNGIWRRPGLNLESTIKWVFSRGSNLVISPGFSHKRAIESIAHLYINEGKGFFLLDSDVDYSNKEFPNVSTFLFKAEQSGFLSGIAASEFLKVNKDIFGEDGKLIVGGFVGLVIPTTLNFLIGFQSGVIAYNIKEYQKSQDPKNSYKPDYVSWSNYNQIGHYASGSFSVGGATTISHDLINNKNCDVIIGISGPQVSDTISAIKNNPRRRPVVIVGVDTAQENNENLQEDIPKNFFPKGSKIKLPNGEEGNQGIIQFSAIKKLNEAVKLMMASIFNTKDPNNKNKIDELSSNNSSTNYPVGGFGYENIGHLGNESTGVSSNGIPYVKEFDSEWILEKDKLNVDKIISNSSFLNMINTGHLYDFDSTNENMIKELSELKSNDDFEKIILNNGGKIIEYKNSPFGNNRLISEDQNTQPKKMFKNKKNLNAIENGWTFTKSKKIISKTPNQEKIFKRNE